MDINAQKYKIWVNSSWIVFVSARSFDPTTTDLPLFVLLQEPNVKMILHKIAEVQVDSIKCPIIISLKDAKSTWKKVLAKIPNIIAAGGIVQRSDKKYLFIYRRGFWDLPKGKLDNGETIKQAAIREVKEEVGLSCKIVSAYPNTYHTYLDKGRLVIKETFWYAMTSVESQVVLQTEEDIEKHQWMSKVEFKKISKKIYPNLLGLLDFVK